MSDEGRIESSTQRCHHGLFALIIRRRFTAFVETGNASRNSCELWKPSLYPTGSLTFTSKRCSPVFLRQGSIEISCCYRSFTSSVSIVQKNPSFLCVAVVAKQTQSIVAMLARIWLRAHFRITFLSAQEEIPSFVVHVFCLSYAVSRILLDSLM